MRHRIIAIAAALAACAGTAAHAGTVTYAIDFSPLAADAGQTVTTTFTQNGFDVTVRNALVVGPGNPDYSGVIGVIPEVNTLSLSIAPDPGPSFGWISLSGTFAAGPNADVNWAGRANFTPPGVLLTYWLGTAPGTVTYTPGGGANPPIVYPTTGIDLEPVVIPTQLVGLSIVGEVSSATPEPSALALGGLGLGAIVLASLRRRLRRRPDSCRE